MRMHVVFYMLAVCIELMLPKPYYCRLLGVIIMECSLNGRDLHSSIKLMHITALFLRIYSHVYVNRQHYINFPSKYAVL